MKTITAGYVFTMAGVTVSWSSKKQNITALSTIEAELMGLLFATHEALWFQQPALKTEMMNAEVPIKTHMKNHGCLYPLLKRIVSTKLRNMLT